MDQTLAYDRTRENRRHGMIRRRSLLLGGRTCPVMIVIQPMNDASKRIESTTGIDMRPLCVFAIDVNQM